MESEPKENKGYICSLAASSRSHKHGNPDGRDLPDDLDEVSGTERAAALQLACAGLQGRRVGHNQHVVSYKGRKHGQDPRSNNEAARLPDAAPPLPFLTAGFAVRQDVFGHLETPTHVTLIRLGHSEPAGRNQRSAQRQTLAPPGGFRLPKGPRAHL